MSSAVEGNESREQQAGAGGFAGLFATALQGAERQGPQRLRLEFDGSPEVETAARDIIATETACCSFLGFAVSREPESRLRVEVTVPPGREPTLDGIARHALAALEARA